MPKRVGIIQSNYMPWKGYFDFIASCDEFVLLDDVQYTRRDWRNRNRIKAPDGLRWITVPVEVKGKFDQRIDETQVAGPEWAEQHARTIQHCYGKAKHFKAVWPFVEALYAALASEPMLSRINDRSIREIAGRLEIATPIRRSEEFGAEPGKNERLIEICRSLGADVYVSGPAARAYMDMAEWKRAGLMVEFKSYADYPEYDQAHPPFEHAVTILDLLLQTGDDAPRYFRSANPFEAA